MRSWNSLPPLQPLNSNSPAPSVLELIRSAVGSAQLLMSQKVQQFFRLCQQNLVSIWNIPLPNNTAMPAKGIRAYYSVINQVEFKMTLQFGHKFYQYILHSIALFIDVVCRCSLRTMLHFLMITFCYKMMSSRKMFCSNYNKLQFPPWFFTTYHCNPLSIEPNMWDSLLFLSPYILWVHSYLSVHHPKQSKLLLGTWMPFWV